MACRHQAGLAGFATINVLVIDQTQAAKENKETESVRHQSQTILHARADREGGREIQRDTTSNTVNDTHTHTLERERTNNSVTADA